MSSARPLPTVIGPTENALRALLSEILSATRIGSYAAWVVLNAAADPAAASSGGRWRLGVADALKIGPDAVDDVLARLRAAGLVDGAGGLTPLGAVELAAARSTVSATTSRLVDGIGEEEQAIARKVLDHVRRRANDLTSPGRSSAATAGSAP